MSLMTQAIVADKYGLRLTMAQLADAIGLAKQTIYNQIAKDEFKVKTYVDGGQRWCDYRDLAAFLDGCRDRAETRA